VSDLIRLVVDFTVNLNGEPRLGTIEVEDIGADRMLAPKLEPAKLPVLQP
jgi:hypothetical protein